MSFRRNVAVVTAAVLFFTLACPVDAAGTSVWTDRRSRADAAVGDRVGAILGGLGSVRPAPLDYRSSSSLPAHVREGLRLVPASAGTVRRLELAPTGGPLLVHIHDVHRNAEAQRGISAIVRSFAAAGRADLVALEGAFGPLDFSDIRRFPARDSVADAAQVLLDRHEITGPVADALTGAEPYPFLTGVDDTSLHARNVEAYRATASIRSKFDDRIRGEAEVLARESAAAFTPELKRFDDVVGAYRRRALGLGDYAAALRREAPHSAAPALDLFLAARALESALDFDVVERERAALIRALAARLDERGADRLLAAGADFRRGAISHSEFYALIGRIADAMGVPLSRYPSMSAYLRYVSLAEAVSPERLFEETAAMEAAVYARLADTAIRRELVSRGRRLYLEAQLSRFALTPSEWTEYKALSKRDPISNAFRGFYEAAEARDTAMAAKLVAEIRARGARTAVLVTGGFHAPGIEAAARRAGLSVMGVVPRLTRADLGDGSAYLGVFAQEKTPLDKLFEGGKLFLAEQISAPAVRGRVAVEVDARQVVRGRPERLAPGRDARLDGSAVVMPVPEAGVDVVVPVGEAGATGKPLLRPRGVIGRAGEVLRKAFGEETALGPTTFWQSRWPAALIAAGAVLGAGGTVFGLVALGVAGFLWVRGQARFLLRHEGAPGRFYWRIGVRALGVIIVNAAAVAPALLAASFDAFGMPYLSEGVAVIAGIVLSTAVHTGWNLVMPASLRLSLPMPENGNPRQPGQGQLDIHDGVTYHRYVSSPRLEIEEPRVIYVLLPVNDGEQLLPGWMERMVAAIDRVPDKFAQIEILIGANGCKDHTLDVALSLMTLYRDRIRMTMVDIKEPVGKNRTMEILAREARRRYELGAQRVVGVDAYICPADDDITLPSNGREDKESQFVKLVELLEATPARASEILRVKVERKIRIAGTSPTSAPIKTSPSFSFMGRLYSFIVQVFTNIRRGRHGVALAQIYGQFYMMKLDDFPRAFPKALRYEDCYLCAEFFPDVYSHPDSYHEHPEPDRLLVFMRRFIRDVLHRTDIDKVAEGDAAFSQRAKAFQSARGASHAELTKAFKRRYPFPLHPARILHAVNGWIKTYVSWSLRDTQDPNRLPLMVKIILGVFGFFDWLFLGRDKRNRDVGQFTRGTNLTALIGGRLTEVLLEEKEATIFVSDGGVVRKPVDQVWDIIVARGLEGDRANMLTIDQIIETLNLSPDLRRFKQEDIMRDLHDIWDLCGVPYDQPVQVTDFAAAVTARIERVGVGEEDVFLNMRLYVYYYALHSADNWQLAQAAYSGFIRLLNRYPYNWVVQEIYDIAARTQVPMSPLLAQLLLDTACNGAMAIRMDGRTVLFDRRAGGVWFAAVREPDSQRETPVVFSLSTPEQYKLYAETHQIRRDRFAEPAFFDPLLGVRATYRSSGESLAKMFDEEYSLEEWIDIAIQVGEAAQAIHDHGYQHGDLRRPNAINVAGRGARPRIWLLDTGASSWTPHLPADADIFGLANMLYYALSGRDASLTEAYMPIPGIPDGLQAILRRALKGDGADGEAGVRRYRSMGEFLAALRTIQAGFHPGASYERALNESALGMSRDYGVAFRSGQARSAWQVELPPGSSWSDDRVQALLTLLSSGAHFSSVYLGLRMLEAYCAQGPTQYEQVERLARASGAILPPTLVVRHFRERMRNNGMVRVSGRDFMIKKELNSRTYLCIEVGETDPVILKITDEQENHFTRQSNDGLWRGHDPSVGVMMVTVHPHDFEYGLDPSSPLYLPTLLQSFIDAAMAVSQANAKGFLHRDLFRHNLRRDVNGNVHLIDWGLSERATPETARVDVMVLAQEIFNTLLGRTAWIPLAYTFKGESGGVALPKIPSFPPRLLAILDRAVQRGYPNTEAFVHDLIEVRREWMLLHEAELRDALEDGRVGAMLNSRSMLFRRAHYDPERAAAQYGVPRAFVEKINEDIDVVMEFAAHLPLRHRERVVEAIGLARFVHEGQFRSNYERQPYFSHVIRVARILIETYRLADVVPGQADQADILCAALLHDVIEDAVKGDFGRQRKDVIGEVGVQNEIRARVASLGRNVAMLVGQLTKPEAGVGEGPAEAARRELEYANSVLVGSSIGLQLIKMADWHHNVAAFRESYMNHRDARGSAARFFSARFEAMMAVIDGRGLPIRERLVFLFALHFEGLAANRMNAEFNPPVTEPVVTAEQFAEIERRMDLLGRQSDPPHQTWGLWSRWFGIAPERAFGFWAPRLESATAFAVFLVTLTGLLFALPGIPWPLVVAASAGVAQALYAAGVFTGSMVYDEASGRWEAVAASHPRAPPLWRSFAAHFSGPGLLFHIPFYLLVLAFPYIGDASSAADVALMAVVGVAALLLAQRRHAAHNLDVARRVLADSSARPLDMQIVDMLPMAPETALSIKRDELGDALGDVLDADLGVIALDSAPDDAESFPVFLATLEDMLRHGRGRVFVTAAPGALSESQSRQLAALAARAAGRVSLATGRDAEMLFARLPGGGMALDIAALNGRLGALARAGSLPMNPRSVKVLSSETLVFANQGALPPDSYLRGAVFRFLDRLLREATAAMPFDQVRMLDRAFRLISSQA